MTWQPLTPTASTWAELREQLHDLSSSDQLACRGQGKDFGNGALFSSLDRALRTTRTTGPLAVASERIAIQRFLQQAPNYLSVAEQQHLLDPVSMLMLMRHYGGPTRLLDWTSSVWVAAFNAASGQWNEPGLVWVFQRDKFDALVHSRYGHQTKWATKSVRVPGIGPALPAITVLQLEQWACRLFGLGPKIPRVIAQQGMFTVGSQLGIDHAAFVDAVVPDEDPPLKRVLHIPGELKATAVKELAKMGISAASMYPGVDGIGRSLVDFVHFASLDQGVETVAQGEYGRLFPARDGDSGQGVEGPS